MERMNEEEYEKLITLEQELWLLRMDMLHHGYQLWSDYCPDVSLNDLTAEYKT